MTCSSCVNDYITIITERLPSVWTVYVQFLISSLLRPCDIGSITSLFLLMRSREDKTLIHGHSAGEWWRWDQNLSCLTLELRTHYFTTLPPTLLGSSSSIFLMIVMIKNKTGLCPRCRSFCTFVLFPTLHSPPWQFSEATGDRSWQLPSSLWLPRPASQIVDMWGKQGNCHFSTIYWHNLCQC